MNANPALDLLIRPRRPEDDERGLEIYHQHETVFTMTLDAWRFHFDERVREEGTKPEMFMGVLDNEIVGDSYMEPNPWSADPGAFSAAVETDVSYQNRGIGSRLWEDLEPKLRARGARKAYTQIVEGDDRATSFAQHRGFSLTGRATRISRLTVADVNWEGYHDLEDRLAAGGIVVKSIAQLNPDDEIFMRQLHEAIQDGAQDIPSSEEFKPAPYERWRQNFLKGPSSSPEAYWVALEGGKPLGIANFDLPAPGRAFNGLTAVRRSARGKGVARLLKMHSIEWARDHGIDFIDTGNDATNERMLAINIALGYKPLPARLEWLKEY